MKKLLVASGFEVFRTLSTEVVLAERVRENLILDSGVRLVPLATGAFQVRLVLRAQRTDFPNDDEGALFARVRQLAEPAVSRGFAESASSVTPVTDPVDATRTLDTFYELSLSRDVSTLDDALDLLRFGLSLEKAVTAR